MKSSATPSLEICWGFSFKNVAESDQQERMIDPLQYLNCTEFNQSSLELMSQNHLSFFTARIEEINQW